MIKYSFNGRIAASFGAALLLSTPLLRAADTVALDQAEVQKFIVPASRTVATASSTALATAVADAIADINASNPNGLTPAGLASSPFAPIPATGKVRAASSTTGGLVAAAAINELKQLNDVSFNADVASVTDAIVGVKNGVKFVMSVADQGNTVRGAVAEVALLGNTIGTASYLSALQNVSATLSTDANLLALPKNGIATILETGLKGVITFPRGTVGISAPVAAQDFAMGLTGTAATTPSSLVTILRGVATNTRVDNFFAYGIASSGSSQLAIGQALLKAYPSATAQITQGLAASIVSGTGADPEAARSAFAQNLTLGTSTANTVGIVEGLAYVDPYYTKQFTNGVFSALLTGTSRTLNAKLLVTDASKIALGLGQVLGADGDVLTQVANVYGNYITAGNLPAASAGTYITNLISGAVNSKVVLAGASPGYAGDVGYGGKLAATTTGTVSAGVVQDLTSIADQIVRGVVSKDLSLLSTARGLSTVSALVGKIAADVARYVKNATFTDPNDSVTTSVAAYIAGTVTNVVSSLVPAGDLAKFQAAITSAVKALTNSTFDVQVVAKVSSNNDGTVGEIAVQETPITNR